VAISQFGFFMEITYHPPKVYRLDFTKSVLKINPLILNQHLEVVYNIYPRSDRGKSDCVFSIRIASHVTEESTNKEAIGYVAEFFGTFYFSERRNAKKEILHFVENAFLQYEVHYGENKPLGLEIGNIMPNNNADAIANEIVILLQDDGYRL
jgi:hypothetical protein